jgi:hypothetical protein
MQPKQQQVHVDLVNDLLFFIIHHLKPCMFICYSTIILILFLYRWDWVVILLVLYTGIITPYTISFLSDEDQKRTHLNAYAATRQFNRERTSIHVLVIIDVLVDFMFVFDILISFR